MSDLHLIYLVDDAADYRQLVQQVCRLFLPQQPVRFFASGTELVQHIKLSPPPDRPVCLIVLDMDMPGLNGLQTLEELKRHADWQAVPVVMMTNQDSADLMQESFRLGADAFLLKPLDILEIQTVLRALCEQESDYAHLVGLDRWVKGTRE